ncbi:hypothetical protein BDB01DRAFT_836423 [Pilobolus umbonatus]|nr:hypothetical protein BDB01DRAFT_836423 [Pilobolus umbonatus]
MTIDRYGLVWYVSQLMYIHHKNYVFQKRWSKNRYPTHMNMYDTPPRIGLISLFYNIHMDPIYESQPSWIPILFYANPFSSQTISLTMTICSWLWVDSRMYIGDCEIDYHLSILDIQPDKHQHLFLRANFMGNNSRLISQPFNVDITVFSSYNHKKQAESLALLLY